MISSGFKKFALENGMTVSHGVAYGSLRGYAATFTDGANMKTIVFSTRFADPAKKAQFMDYICGIGEAALQKDYRVANLGVDHASVKVIFTDTFGTMKKIRAFVDWFIPVLQTYGASTVDVCTECGGQVQSGSWVMIDGVCYHVHEACAEKMRNAVDSGNEQRAQERTGSYLTGAVGAFLGAALGAIVWGLVLVAGYVASIVGLLIGWLADKGYNLLKGKQGKLKVVILILAVIVGVLLGTIAANVMTLVQLINDGNAGFMEYSDIPAFLMELYEYDDEYRSGVIQNAVTGLVFAALGVGGMLYKAGKEVSDTKFIKLK